MTHVKAELLFCRRLKNVMHKTDLSFYYEGAPLRELLRKEQAQEL